MKYLKRYELWNPFQFKRKQLDFDSTEDAWLEGFNLIKKNSKEYYYKSDNSDFDIVITKYYNKDTYREYKIMISDEGEIREKKAIGIIELREIIKNNIPKIDIDTKKYNL
jgi:hypothetical protein